MRTGHRHQQFVVTPQGVGSGAVGVAVGADLPASSQGALGMSSEVRNAGGGLRDHDGESYTLDNDSGVNISASSFQLPDPSVIDHLKITINHPTGLYTTDSEDGDSGNAWVELRIIFSYVRDGQTFEQTVFGLDDMAAQPREKEGTRPHVAVGGDIDLNAHDGIIHGKISTQFATVFEFDTEQFQPFDDFTIKIRRFTPTAYKITNKSYHNATQVSYAEAIIEDKLNYPYTAYAAIMVDSRDATTVPQRHYELRGIKCKVPTNYIPLDTMDADGNRTTTASYKRNVTTGATETTDQDWDGKFRGDKKVFTDPNDVNYEPVYTNNPAWVFLDLLTNERYGLGNYLNKDHTMDIIDKYQLYELAKYCDELVDDGQGGQEPRFTCNVYIKDSTEAIKVLKQLMSTFRGILLWHDGEISLNLQQEKAPIFTFTKSNVTPEGFAYSYPSNRVRANQIRVTWNDPDNHYRPAVELVEDSENIAKTGRVVEKSTLAYGCTSQSQAHRVGKYHLLSEINDSEAVTFTSGIGSQILRPGDLIEVQDADRDNVQLSGRVSSGASTTVIPVDRSVALSNTANADLTLIFPKSGAYLAQPNATINSVSYSQGDLILQAKNASDTLYNLDVQANTANARDDSGNILDIAWSEDVRIETKAISNYNASHITVSSAFSDAPNEEVIFAISQTTATGEKLAGSPQTYMISEIKEDIQTKAYNITAVKHTVGKYDKIDRGWSIPTIPDVMIPPKSTDGVPKPRNVMIKLLKGQVDEGSDEEISNANEDRFVPPRLDVYWGVPLSQRTDDNGDPVNSPYEHIRSFEIEHNVNSQGGGARDGFDRVVIDPSRQSFTIPNVPKRGEFIVRIRTINTAGQPSPFVQRRIKINPEKPAKNLEPFVRKGGILTTGFNIDSSNGLVQFTESTYNFTPAETDLQTVTVTSGTTAQTSCSFANLASGNTGYLLWDYSDTTDPLKAVEYITDNTGADLFRYSKNLDASAFTQKTGTATVEAGNTIIQGTGTAFLTEYEAGDLFIFDDSGSNRFIATINHILSNTYMQVAYTPTSNLSSKNVFAQSIQPNFIKDTIIGEVANTSGTFSIINYASGNKGADAYTINGSNENHNFEAANNGAVSDFSTFINNYTVKKGTVSYTFANSGTALNTFGLSKSDSNCTSAINSSNGAITVSALTANVATITVTITDLYSSEVIATRVITLGKSQPGVDGQDGQDGTPGVNGADGSDGAAGADARTVNLTVGDQAFSYSNTGANPSPSSTTVTATATNTTGTVYYEFFLNDVSQQNTTSTTYSYTPQSSFDNMPDKLEVQIRDNSETTVKARDQLTVYGVKPGTDGTDGLTGASTNIVFRRASSAPSTPSASSGVPTGWSDSPPAGTDLLFAVKGTKAVGATNFTWGTVFQVEGTAVAEIPIYRKNSNATPSGGSYNFTTNTLTAPSGWSTSVPSLTTDGDIVYLAVGLFSGSPEETAATTTWSTPVVYAQKTDGTDGDDGADAITIILSNEAHTVPQSNTGTVTYTGSGTDIIVFDGTTQVPYDGSSPYDSPSFRVSASGSSITPGSASTVSTYTRRFGNHSSITANTASVTYTITVKNSAGNELTFTKKQSISKSIDGVDGTPGDDGNTGPRTATGYIFYQSASSSAPTNPSNAGVSYNFSTSLLSGGVIGTGSTNWNQIQPTYTGSNSNKYWYAYFSVVEDSFGDSTPTITFSQAYQGQNFTGLVTFTGTNSISDGTNTHTGITSSDLGSSGTTTIDGGRITTGTIDAARISIAGKNISDLNNDEGYTDDTAANNAANTASAAYGQANNAANSASDAANSAASAQSTADSKVTHAAVNASSTIVGGGVGGWGITTYHIAGGAQSSSSTRNFNVGTSISGNATFLANGGILLGSDGFISAKQFYIDTDGNAKFKGDITGASGTFSGSISVDAFNSGYTGSDAESDASDAANAASDAANTASSAFGAANNAANTAGDAYGAANNAANTASGAFGAANNAANTASDAYGQANNAANSAAAAQSTADSKVTHAAVNASSTIVGGGVGGWGITTYHLAGGAQANSTTRNFSTGTSTSGNATFLANGGIIMGSDGFLSSNTFYIDTAGNAKFKGTLEGDNVTVNGTLVLPSEGANVNGSVIGSWATNIMSNNFVTEVGSGPGFYQGFVRVTGGTHYVKTVSIQIRTGTSTGSQGTLIYETPRIDQYTAGNISEARLYANTSPVASGNMPIAFTYTGSGSVSVFVRAQADTGPDTLGIGEARFIKFGTTDPVFSFANQAGAALSTAIYSNTQVVGGFAGTKTVNISNTSFTRFKIDNGSFGTANAQIANGSYINVEITSASANLTTRETTVLIGRTSEVYSVTTGGTGGGTPPGGGGGCFVQGTPVVMADGTTKAIEDVTTGESVKSFRHSSLSLDEDAWETWTTSEIANGSFGTSNVTLVTDPHQHTNYYWVNYNLKVTNEHPMLAFKDNVFKFVRVEDLEIGDYLIRENGTREEIFAIPRIYQDCITHNMDVEDDDTYVVRGGNGIGYIAHNVENEQKA